MRILGNIIWHIPFLGFVSAFLTFLIGGILTLTVVGAPIGLGLIQLSRFLLAPFTNVMADRSGMSDEDNKAWKVYGYIVRIIYLPIGLLLSVVVLIQTVLMFLSIIGIPVAIVLAKSLSTYFNPVHKVCVSRSAVALA